MVTVAGSSAREAEARPIEMTQMPGTEVETPSIELTRMPGAEAVAPLPVLAPQLFADTIPVSIPRFFGGRLLVEPRYLTRVVRSVQLESAEEIATSISREADAATFAQRYKISEQLAAQIIDAALAEGLDPELGFRLVRVESVFRTNARGSGGALGLTQLMPGTARAIDRSLRSESQILDPVTNLRTGFRYLRTLIERYDGNVRLGVLAYNRGETAVDRALRAGRDPENGYSPKVLGTVAAAVPYRGTGTVPRSE